MILIKKALNFQFIKVGLQYLPYYHYLPCNYHYSRIGQKNNICNEVFCYENDSTYPVYVSNKKFENCFDLLGITNKNKPHYVYIKGFNRYMSNKTKCKIKKTLLQVFNVLVVKKF